MILSFTLQLLHQVACKLNNRVFATLEVLIGHADVIMRLNAKLRAVLLCIVHGTGRETDVPAIRQAGGEGHAGTAARPVAHYLDLGQGLHVHGELVGGAEDAAVGKYYHLLVPAQA